MSRTKKRIPIVLKNINWKHFLNYIDSNTDENYIKKHKKLIRKYWLENPDLRLVQVLVNLKLIDEMSVIKYYVEEVDYLIDNNFINPEKILFWGTYGKNGTDPLKWVLIKDLDSSHIEAILKTQKRIKGLHLSTMKNVLRKRKLENLSISNFRKGDLVEIKGEQFKLISEPYENKKHELVFKTNKNKEVSYKELRKHAELMKTDSGRKNI